MYLQSQSLIRRHLDEQEEHAHEGTAVEADDLLAGEEVEEDVEDVDEGGEGELEFAVESGHVLGLLHEHECQVVLDVEVGQNGEGVEESLGLHGHEGADHVVAVAEDVHLAVLLVSQPSSERPSFGTRRACKRT